MDEGSGQGSQLARLLHRQGYLCLAALPCLTLGGTSLLPLLDLLSFGVGTFATADVGLRRPTVDTLREVQVCVLASALPGHGRLPPLLSHEVDDPPLQQLQTTVAGLDLARGIECAARRGTPKVVLA